MTKVGFVVLLESADDDRILPIHIGPPEAQAMLLFLNDVPVPRPLTHALFQNVLESLTVAVTDVVIRDLRQETFFATLNLAAGEKTLPIDCRPSDAIVLALRCAAPIFIADFVMEQAGIHLREVDDEAIVVHGMELESDEDSPAAAPVRPENPLLHLQAELRKAIEEERYEDAALLRDRISKLSGAAS